MATPIEQLKAWFSKGKKPTEEQFHAWLDSYFHKDENIPAESIEGLTATLAGKAASTHTHSPSSIGAQPTLVSGNSIKTINGQSILGGGNLSISGGDGGSEDLSTPWQYIGAYEDGVDIYFYIRKNKLGAVEILGLEPQYYNEEEVAIPDTVSFTGIIPKGFEPDMPTQLSLNPGRDPDLPFSFNIYDLWQGFIGIGEIQENTVRFNFNIDGNSDKYEWNSWGNSLITYFPKIN
jgi:hypothetical protein